MLKSLAAAGGVLLALALVPASARADAIGPPPTNCPDGTTGQSCHNASYCQAQTCTTDADCSAGLVCQPRSYCQITAECGATVFGPDGGYMSEPMASVGEPCASAGDCDAGTCASMNVCVSSSSSSGGCSVEAPRSGGGPLALSALAMIAGGAGAALRYRRRSRAASAQRRA